MVSVGAATSRVIYGPKRCISLFHFFFFESFLNLGRFRCKCNLGNVIFGIKFAIIICFHVLVRLLDTYDGLFA